MEYVQTVLFKIPATRVDDALAPGGVLADLEAHHDIASAQPGFRGMQITRTANPEGDALVVVETRWATNNALADYTTLRTNAATIVEQHADQIVPGSLQTYRMEALATERTEAPTRVYDRIMLPLLIPAGVLAFALLVIYGLSRIYLSLPNDAATPLAAVIALAILGLAFYFAANPNLPRWQIGGVVAAGLAALAIGGVAAAIYDEGHKEFVQAEPTAPSTGGGSPGANEIDMVDNAFQPASLTVTTGTTITLKNKGQATHNVHVADASGTYASPFCRVGGPTPCSDPASIPGGGSGTILINIPAGTYDFRCDFHPTQMTGKLTVQ
jgi:plastocyanin/heme-degrading monooxygenase HmoA